MRLLAQPIQQQSVHERAELGEAVNSFARFTGPNSSHRVLVLVHDSTNGQKSPLNPSHSLLR
jgi:hypothetical protein